MIKVALLHEQLQQAGIPVQTVLGDGRIFYTRVLTPEEEALIAQVIAAHDPTILMPYEQDELDAEKAKVEFRQLPDWATWSPGQARDYVDGSILNGMDKVAIDTWIDTNVTSLATAKTALKLLGEAIVDTRTVLKIVAMAVIYFRQIVVRRY